MKKKILCLICKKDARRIRDGIILKDVGVEIWATDKEPAIILCENCIDRINSHYDY